MIAILDYEAGNLTSVKRALDHLEVASVITADHETISNAEGIIFPGVGAAGSAMRTLTQRRLDDLIRREIAREKPLLGICVGCQVLLEHSQENTTDTLGVFPGQCRRFDDTLEENGRPINIFDWVSIPSPMARNEGLHEILEVVHVNTAYVLIGLVLVHILGAVKHIVFESPTYIMRMITPRSRS